MRKPGIIIFSIGAILSLVSFHSPEVEEKVKYKVMYGNSEVGTLNAVKVREDGRFTYKVETSVKARLIKMFHVIFKLNSTFNNDSLVQAHVKSIVNEKVWDYSSIEWKENCYHIKKAKKESYNLCKRKATYSTAILYFREPKEHDQIFSESYTQFVPLKDTKSSGYELQLPSGNNNYYHYDDQGLKEAIINDAMIKLRFVRY